MIRASTSFGNVGREKRSGLGDPGQEEGARIRHDLVHGSKGGAESKMQPRLWT